MKGKQLKVKSIIDKLLSQILFLAISIIFSYKEPRTIAFGIVTKGNIIVEKASTYVLSKKKGLIAKNSW